MAKIIREQNWKVLLWFYCNQLDATPDSSYQTILIQVTTQYKAFIDSRMKEDLPLYFTQLSS